MSNSPFRPGYGKQPIIFGGHHSELAELRHVFAEYDFGENSTVILSGLRGTGKTAMLGELHRAAEELGWLVIADDASEGISDRLMNSHIPSIINTLTEPERRILSGIGIWQFNAHFELQDTTRQVKPLLRDDLLAIAKATDSRGVLITIDEVAYGRTNIKELTRVALEISHVIGKINLMFVLSGIRLDLDRFLNEEHVTFLRRSRSIDFRRLSPAETRDVLVETVKVGGRSFSEDALTHLIRVSQGYPYLIQLLGDYSWRHNINDNTIDLDAARAAQQRALVAIEDRVIARAYEDLSDVDRVFVQALAETGDRASTSDIRRRMKSRFEAAGKDPEMVTAQYVNRYRNRLIDSGYVESDGHGYVRLSLPYLGDYIRSFDADFDPDGTPSNEWDAFPPPEL